MPSPLLQQPVRLHRLATAEHLCPYGQLAVELLRQQGIPFEDHLLTSQLEADRFKAAHGVATTPQLFAGGERIGGYADLARRLGVKPRQPGGRSYRPVIAVFATAGLIALALGLGAPGFMGVALALLACLKLMDPAAFAVAFRKYDRLSRGWRPYAGLYPYLELLVGVTVLAGRAAQPIGLLAMLMGLEGAVSVIRAVYIERLDLNCACVGGNSRTPLGLVSVLENGAMVAMGLPMALGS
jgi:glutaredoxin